MNFFFPFWSSFVIAWSGRFVKTKSVSKPLVAIVDKTEQARRRRHWTRGFSTAALKGYEPFVKSRSLQFIQTLASKNLKETQNLTEWCAFLAYDIMMDLACVIWYPTQVNSPLNLSSLQLWRGFWDDTRWGPWRYLACVGRRTKVTVLKLVDSNIKFFFYSREIIFTSHIPWLAPIILTLPGLANNARVVREHSLNCGRRRVKEGSTRKDLFHHLVRLQPPFSAWLSIFTNVFQIDEDNLGTSKPTISEVLGEGVWNLTSMKRRYGS